MSRRVWAGIVVGVACAAVVLVGWRSLAQRHAIQRNKPAPEFSDRSPAPPVWVTTDTPSAQLRLDNLGSVSLREVSDLLALRNRAEIAQLARAFDALGNSAKISEAITQFFKAWAQLDPDAALKESITFTDRAKKETALRAIFESVSPEAAGRLAGALRDAPRESVAPMVRSELLARAVSRWSEFDPARGRRVPRSKPGNDNSGSDERSRRRLNACDSHRDELGARRSRGGDGMGRAPARANSASGRN